MAVICEECRKILEDQLKSLRNYVDSLRQDQIPNPRLVGQIELLNKLLEE